MADFTLNEFIEFLTEISLSYPSLGIDVDEFRRVVERDLDDIILVHNKESSYRRPVVPERYGNYRLEFLIVYHLGQQFFEGLSETEYIVGEFQKYAELNAMVMVNSDDNEIDRIDLKVVNVETLMKDRRELAKIFNEIGKAMLGELFDNDEFLRRT